MTHEIKQFGLRRSGTNYTKVLLEHNYNVKVLSHAAGHKHEAYAVPKYNKGEELDCIVTIRHPMSWLLSVWYYWIGTARKNGRNPDEKFGSFKQYVLKGDALHLYNKLNLNWINIKLKQRRLSVVRYEDLYRRPHRTCKALARNFYLPDNKNKDEFWIPRNKLSTNGSETNEKFHERKWRKAFGPRMAKYVRNHVDKYIIERFGYDLS